MPELDLSSMDTDQPVEINLQALEETVPLDKVQFKAMVTTLAAKKVNQQLGIEEGEFHKYASLLQQGMEDSIRSGLATEMLTRRINIIRDLQLTTAEANNPELLQDLLDVEVGYDLETEKMTIIEKAAAAEIVESALEATDRRDAEEVELAEVLKTGEGMTSAERNETIFAKSLLMTDRISKLGDKVLSLSSVADVATDIVAILSPGGTHLILDQNIKTALDPFFTGNDLREQKETFDVMTLAEQTEALDGIINHFEDDPLIALIVVGYLQSLADWEVWIENAGDGLDALLSIPIAGQVLNAAGKFLFTATKAVKITKNLMQGRIATAGIAAGNRIKAVEQTEAIKQGVMRGDVVHDSEMAQEAGDLMLETQLKIGDRPLNQGISGKLNQNLNDIHAAKHEFLHTETSSLLSTPEKHTLIREMQEDLVQTMVETGYMHGDILASGIKNPQRIDEDLFGLTYHVLYGNETGLGFSTAAAADKYAGLLKLDGYKITTPEVNGAYFLQVSKRSSNEAGFISATHKLEDSTKRTGFLARYLRSNTNLVEAVSTKAAQLTVAAREGATAAAKRLEKIKYAVPKKEQEYLDQVIELGTREAGGIFYSVTTLKDRFKFTDAQVSGYKAFQAEEDLFHLLENSSVFTRRNSEGYKTITLKKAIKGLESFTAKPVSAADVVNPANKNIWSASTRKMQSNVTPEDLKRLEDKGWRILQMEGAVENAALSPVQYVLMKAGDATVDNLSLMQIPYRPGGRVQYADKTFLKMGRVREIAGGVPIILRAKTFGVGETENVKDAVKAYEEARQAWMKGGSDADAAIELATSGRFKNREAFQDAIGLKNLEMSRTHNMPFEAVRDGEVLAGVRAKMAKGASFLAEDVAEANTIQRMILQQGSTRSQRGERLPMFGENRMEDFNFDLGRTAPILSPRETASASMSRAIQVMSLDNFRSRQTKIWFDSFSDVIDIEKSPGRTPLGWLMESDKKKYIKPRDKINSVQYKKDVRTINLARTHEQHLRMTMNTPTRYDMARDQIAEGIIASVAPSLSKIGVSEQRLEKIAQADPIKFLRSVTFHTKLGLGGFNQPIVQLQSAALMASIEPVHGTQAILTTPILGLMLMSENSKTLGHMAKIAVRMAPGSDAKVIQEGLEVLKKTNNWRLNSGSLVEQDYHHLSAPTFLGRAIELGRAPFINSERFNKIASTYAAFLKWRKANPNTKIDSDVIDHIRTRGNQMVASMDSVDKSQWQSGVAGAVTQFWGYQARLIEMAAPEAWGGSKAFSPTEKLRIVAGQFAMHGVGGTLGVGPGRKFREILNAEYSQRYGEEPSSDFLDNVEKGMISGYLLPLLLDTDQVNFQTRGGAGLFDSGPIPVIEAFLSGDLDGLPQLDIAGMKLLSDVHEDWSNFLNTVKYVTNWEDAWLVFSVEGMKIFTENISSLRDVEKMRWALDFETFTNNSGGITDTDVNWKRAVAKMFGIDTGSAAATFAAKSILKEMKKDIGKAGRDHAKTLRLWAAGRLTDNDMKKFNFLGQARYGNDWGAIAKSAIRNMSKQEKHKIALLLKAKYYQGTGE